MFWRRVEQAGSREAQVVKRKGVWHRLRWDEVAEVVREVALGLIDLGLEPGDRVALLAGTRAEWVQTDLAILSAGGVTVPIYPSYTAGQIAHIVDESEARMLVVETPAQLARVLEARAKMPRLEQIVVIAPEDALRGVLAWEELRRQGRTGADRLRRLLAERVASAGPEDVATIVYTSGTTGEPKGVVQTHGNHLASLRAVAQIAGAVPGDIHLLFLPLAHSFARLEAFMAVHRGLVTAFAESLDRLGDNLREVRPDFIFGVPRVFEKARAGILAAVETGSAARRRLFGWALGVGLEVARRPRDGQRLPPGLALAHALARRGVLTRLHRALGGRLRFAVSGGAPLAVEVAEFFHAAGLLIVEGYGLTEACPALTFNRLEYFKFGSVGQAIPGVELRLAADGEILARGPNIATRGYWKQPAATAEAFTPDGWLRTGDIGHLDEDGFLYITDRKKELIITSGGVNIAPQPIETRLRADPIIAQAMVYGDRRPYPTALVALAAAEAKRFARQQGLLVTDRALLARHPALRARIERTVDATNLTLPSYARIKKFAIVPTEFTEEGGELTVTQKIKRKAVADKYRGLIEELYADTRNHRPT